MNYYCLQQKVQCEYANINGYCLMSACAKPAVRNNTHSINCIESIETTSKYFAEITEDEVNVQKATDLLEKFGIQVMTEYGNYRPTYDVLKDIGERWEQLKRLI